MCFVINLLRRVVVSSMISFYMCFCFDNSDDNVRFDKVIKSNIVRHYATNI